MSDSFDEELSEGIAHQTSFDSTAIEEPKEDNEVCEICLDGEVFDDNEILFCDKCNVAVHQLCYGIKEIPQDAWFCFPCQEGFDPKTLHCELCSYSGGAYKRCSKGNKWAHPLCCCWIPEVYEVSVPGKPSALNLERLDQKRFKLKCGLCTKKGACVQCAYGRCTQGMHPWCALRSPQCTRRIIKGDEGVLLWEIFCKAHANAVGEAPKHKSKAKASKIHEDTDGHDDMAYWSTDNAYFEEKESRKENSWKNTNWSSPFSTQDDFLSKTVSQLLSELMSQELSKNVIHANDDHHNSLSVISLLEWPGMSEGEAMDLDHFWNYISSFYVEDYSELWAEKNIEGMKLPTSFNHDLHQNGKRSSEDDVEDAIDDALSALGGEREKAAAQNQEKRNMLLRRVYQIIQDLKSKLKAVDQDSGALDDKDSCAVENTLYLLETNSRKEISNNGTVIEDSSLNVVFDGEQRIGCEFVVNPLYFPNPSLVKSLANENPETTALEIGFDEWAAENIIPHRSVEVSNPLPSHEAVELELKRIIPFRSDEIVQLLDADIRPRTDFSEIVMMIAKDYRAYEQLTTVITNYIDYMLEKSDLLENTGKYQLFKLEWKEINNKYVNQQIWKKVGQSIHKGMNHEGDDLTKADEEVLPPSWALEVEGRPKAGSADADEEEEAQEDGLCMCCFDGTSAENNRIVFCDGCNSSMHQICYGIAEIPEGDYYCDRCKFIEKLALTLDEVDLEETTAKDTVKCCLCNLHHGGIKPTTDGRWVHMCCVLWSGEAEIMDMKDMSPINISNLVFQPFPTASERKRSNYLFSETACLYCHQSGGLLVTCSYCQEETTSSSVVLTCNNFFHPLCAWFAGVSIKASITDPSYEARQREGRYPAGVEYHFRCHLHSTGIVEKQKQFRNKYRISERDLEQVPGKAKKKRKKYNRKKDGAGRKTTTSSSAPKDLPPDNYNETVCACCLRPVSNDIFGNGYSSVTIQEIPSPESSLLTGTSAEDLTKTEGLISSTSTDAFHSEEPLVDLTKTSNGENQRSLSSISCSNCRLTLHKECLSEFRKVSDHVSDDNNWICLVCKESDFLNVHCALCPRRGGFFCHTIDGTWAHPYCAKTVPAQTKITSEKRIDIRLISKEGKKQKCSICNRKGGICIQCSSVGCATFFHPLCAARSNKGFVRIRNGSKEAYCNEHIPIGADFIAGFWLDGMELFRFRLLLDRARIILDTLVRREKLKRTLCKTEAELMHAKISKLLDKAKGRKQKRTLSTSGGGDSEEEEDDEEKEHEEEEEEEDLEEDNDEESIDDELFDEFVPLDYLFERQKKKLTGNAISTTSVKILNGENVEIGNTWLNILRSQERKNQSLRKLTRVYFAGIEIKEKNVTNIDRKAYLKHQKEYIFSNEDRLRPRTGFFPHRTAEEKFGQDLGASLIKLLKAGEKEFKLQISKLDQTVEVRFDKVKVKKIAIIEPEKESPNKKKPVRPRSHRKQNKFSKNRRGRKSEGRKAGKEKGGYEESDEGEDEEVDDGDYTEVLSSDVEDEETAEEVDLEDEESLPHKGKKGRKLSNGYLQVRRKRGREDDSAEEEGVEDEKQLPSKKKTKKIDQKEASENLLKDFIESTYYKTMISFFPSFQASLMISNATSTRSTSNLSIVATGFDETLRQINDRQASDDLKINLINWRIFPIDELHRLERWISDILSCLSTYIILERETVEKHVHMSLFDYIKLRTEDYLLHYQDSTAVAGTDLIAVEEATTPVKRSKTQHDARKKRSNRDKHPTKEENEEESNFRKPKLSPINPQKHQSSKTRENNPEVAIIESQDGRYLCEDFEQIPYHLIPNYNDQVKRVMSITAMQEKLHDHSYHCIAALDKDFYLMLNNARMVTQAGSITWKNTKLLEKLYHECKQLLQYHSWTVLTLAWRQHSVVSSKAIQQVSLSSRSSGKGKRSSSSPVTSAASESRVSSRRRAGTPSVTVKEENTEENALADITQLDSSININPLTGLVTCYLCRLQFELVNWPPGMRFADPIVSESVENEELDVKQEGVVSSAPSPSLNNRGEDEEMKDEDAPRRSKRFKPVTDFLTPSQSSLAVGSFDLEIEGIVAMDVDENPREALNDSPLVVEEPIFEPKITRSSSRGREKEESLLTAGHQNQPKSKKKSGALTSAAGAASVTVSEDHWNWVCSNCLHNQGKQLLDHQIQVWWADDYCTYHGIINAYDEVSHSHRVLYYDNEWEFLYLSYEAFLIAFNDKKNASSSSSTAHTGNK